MSELVPKALCAALPEAARVSYVATADLDLATLYGVQTKRLNKQVKRNRDRFPSDFLFQLTADETYPSIVGY